ncbi:hypothetical protein LAZ67_23001523 [Cordylochernes scorpioides]|uniref:Mos1 transposase HTH domain-containing protein n=1 Tax=Cordylochernes scorpioides TaxID=51811 RepID=A0ABY6LQU5_9ARAC|nr:hypothetical protein LAZ67_23001523 [Cordylochernes scorpioides]
MEQKLKQRICIEFCVKLQISSTETFEMLNKAFPNDAPKRTTVFEWHSRFKAGRISIEDDPRQGRPKFQRTDENVQKITDLIKENPRTTLLELEQDTGISKTTVGRIVTEDLKLKKTPAKFIPRFLTNEQKLCRLATCEDMMEMTRTDPEWKDNIITGDEAWVYGYDPETKPQSAEWRGRDPQSTSRSSLASITNQDICTIKILQKISPDRCRLHLLSRHLYGDIQHASSFCVIPITPETTLNIVATTTATNIPHYSHPTPVQITLIDLQDKDEADQEDPAEHSPVDPYDNKIRFNAKRRHWRRTKLKL